LEIDETWLCSDDEVEHVTGQYFVGRLQRKAARSAYSDRERETMWSILTDLAPEAAKMWEFE
jgi:hypothetical protein